MWRAQNLICQSGVTHFVRGAITMSTMKKALVVLALAASASTTASAFIPSSSVKNVVSNVAQKGARFPLATK